MLRCVRYLQIFQGKNPRKNPPINFNYIVILVRNSWSSCRVLDSWIGQRAPWCTRKFIPWCNRRGSIPPTLPSPKDQTERTSLEGLVRKENPPHLLPPLAPPPPPHRKLTFCWKGEEGTVCLLLEGCLVNLNYFLWSNHSFLNESSQTVHLPQILKL